MVLSNRWVCRCAYCSGRLGRPAEAGSPVVSHAVTASAGALHAVAASAVAKRPLHLANTSSERCLYIMRNELKDHQDNRTRKLRARRRVERDGRARRAILEGDSCVVFFGARRVGNGLFPHGRWPLGDGQWIVSARAMTPFGRGTGCSAGGQRALDFLWSAAEIFADGEFLCRTEISRDAVNSAGGQRPLDVFVERE